MLHPHSAGPRHATPHGAAEPVCTRVIGRRRDVVGFAELPGFHTFHGRDWNLAGNLAFLEDLPRGPVHLASARGRTLAAPEARNFFEWECGWLGLNGVRSLCPTALLPWSMRGDPFHAALGQDPLGLHERLKERRRGGDESMPELGPTTARMAWLAQVFGPALAQEGWELLKGGLPYRPVLRFTLAWVQALDSVVRAVHPGLSVVFAPKVEGEFEPLLDMFPDVVAFPTFEPLSRGFLLRARSVPIHPLGLVLAPRFTDGGLRSPLEYFLHDLDHARYKLREDLAAKGIHIPDPYQCAPGSLEPTTLEGPGQNRHRLVLRQAGEAWRSHTKRPALPAAHSQAALARMLGTLDSLGLEVRAAARELLFEIFHEKSLPFRPEILAREVPRGAHTDKLRAKLASGFHGPLLPCVPARLEEAQSLLAALLRARST